MPGVFAAGDVRSGSVKRVASAVGEGSIAIRFVSEYLGLAHRIRRRRPLRLLTAPPTEIDPRRHS